MVSDQLQLPFEGDDSDSSATGTPVVAADSAPPEVPLPAHGRDVRLEAQALDLLDELGLRKKADALEVRWNRRMRSAAGKAFFPGWKIDLNPRLVRFEGETERTLRHELAHLVAYARAGRRRIAPHGREWKKACADLGIPGESACHTLPLPVQRRERKHRYACPVCEAEIRRVRPLRKPAACYPCCRDRNRGRFHERYQLVQVG